MSAEIGFFGVVLGILFLVSFVLVEMATRKVVKGEEVEYDAEQGVSLRKFGGRIFRVAELRSPPDVDVNPFGFMESLDDDIEIPQDLERQLKQNEKGEWVLEKKVNPRFYSFLVGKSAMTKKQIERDTNSYLDIPGKSDKRDTVIISGEKKSEVVSANNHIDLVICQATESLGPNFFLSIPLTDPEIAASLQEFIDTILKNHSTAKGMDPSIFAWPQNFHLTIAMLSLYSEESREEASAKLKRISPHIYDILGTRTLRIRLRGFDSMADDPEDVNVAYASVEEIGGENRLVKLCDYLREEFKEWMPINEIERDLKIHATIINTKSRKDSGGERGRGRGRGRGGGRGRGRRQGVDCRQIFSSFGSHFFGEFSLKSVHLSQRHEFGPDGYWKHLNIVNLP